MTPSQIDIAHRLAERLRGKWRPGMLHAAVNADGELEDYTLVVGCDDPPAHGRVPVLDNDCTTGALLGMVRERSKAPFAQASPVIRYDAQTQETIGKGWRVYFNDPADTEFPRMGQPLPTTEGEALALALLEVL